MKTKENDWKDTFDQVIARENIKDTGLSFQAEAPLSIDKIQVHMRKSNLFLLPLKQTSPLFGTEALMQPLQLEFQSWSPDTLVYQLFCVKYNMKKQSSPKTNQQINTETWKRLIIQKLTKPEEAHRAAVRLREQLLLESSISQTHLDFIHAITGR